MPLEAYPKVPRWGMTDVLLFILELNHLSQNKKYMTYLSFPWLGIQGKKVTARKTEPIHPILGALWM